MTRRMFLSVPSDPIVPEGNGVTYLPGGLMVDLSADMRCGTCQWWRPGGFEHSGPMCYLGKNSDDPDFGCTKWEPTKE